ncbi:dehydrogenase [Rhodococcus triatomae BKS 15-14]|nr:dehydrogenase [Rhodococcus triatomae BKS 15-14]
MGASGKVITDWVGNGRLTRFGARFVNLVYPGDTLTTTATVESLHVDEKGRRLADFSLTTTNQDGLPVITGQATAEVGYASASS